MASEKQDIREAYRMARALELVVRTMKFRHRVERDLAAGRVSKKAANEMLSLADAVLDRVKA